MAEAGTPEKVAELVKDVKIAMLTFIDEDGTLHSKPMATQDVDFTGDIWFIGERDSRKSRAIMASPPVNVGYSGSGSWVSVAGNAEVVDDVARLKDLWNTFTDAWLEGGPENPNNVLIHVAAASAEYWDSPGGKVVQVANLVKAKATGQRYEGENEQVEL